MKGKLKTRRKIRWPGRGVVEVLCKLVRKPLIVDKKNVCQKRANNKSIRLINSKKEKNDKSKLLLEGPRKKQILRATNWKGKRTKGQQNKATNEIKQNTSKALGGKYRRNRKKVGKEITKQMNPPP